MDPAGMIVTMRRRIVVGSIWTVTLGCALALVAASRYGGSGLTGGSFSVVFAALGFDIVVYATVGAILSMRRPGNLVGIVLLAAAVLLALTFLGFILGALWTATRGFDDTVAGLAALIGGLGIYPALIVAGPALALVFPDGRLPAPRWRWSVGAIAVILATGSTLVVVAPGPLGDSLANNPFGVTGIPWLAGASVTGAGLSALALPAALLLAVAAVVVRFRRAQGVERQQLKWFVAANMLIATLLTLSLADGGSEPTVFDVLAVCSLSLPPIAVGLAILRYRLYEIDRIVSRTISWAIVTGLLVAVLLAGIAATQTLLAPFTRENTIAVAASTLTAAAVFQPLRRRVQRAVDRRFDRARYDGQRTVDAFAERLRSDVDLGSLRASLAATADQAVRPAGSVVWLRGGSR
jgi:hypothetical protein